jgi:uncharacterized protein YegL
MSLLDDLEKMAMTVFFVIDASHSMNDLMIASVKLVIKEIISKIKDVSSVNAKYQIKIAAMKFNSECFWITPFGPVEAEEFHLDNIESFGNRNFGAACRELNLKLSDDEFLKKGKLEWWWWYSDSIIILFMSDVPDDDFHLEIKQLNKDYRFRKNFKFAFSLGNNSIVNILEQFTDNIWNIDVTSEVHNSKVLQRIINFINQKINQHQNNKPVKHKIRTDKISSLTDFYMILDDFVDNCTKDELKICSADTILMRYHSGLGTSIRNSFLFKPYNENYYIGHLFFEKITHIPDNISSILLYGYHWYLNGVTMSVDETIKKYYNGNIPPYKTNDELLKELQEIIKEENDTSSVDEW